MIIKYNDILYADIMEDCFLDNGVEDIDYLLINMDCNGDIESYTTRHYMIDGYEFGDDDDNITALENLIKQNKYGYSVPIEVIKE